MSNKTVAPETKQTKDRIVNSHPFPIPARMGDVITVPTQEKMFRMKLFKATPADDFRGKNSVSIVVTSPKINMDPIPKQKLAIICRRSQSV